MSKKIVLSGIGLMFLLSPLLVSAQTIADLQAQIQALLAQIAELQAQTLPPTTPPPDSDDYPTTPIPYNTCPNLTVTMQRGARDATTGGQVSELQIFLANYYDLNEEDVITGYFGRVTEKYVIRFQREQGLPTFGIVGSLTRAAIARGCGGGTSQTFSASPTSGAAPLTTTFRAKLLVAGKYALNFGDGTATLIFSVAEGVCSDGTDHATCGLSLDAARHTYTSAGTYTAKLRTTGGPTAGQCNALVNPDCNAVGKVTVTVTDTTVVFNEQCTGFAFTRNHKIGDQGGEVAEVRKFVRTFRYGGGDGFNHETIFQTR